MIYMDADHSSHSPMQITLRSPDLERFVQAKVSSGEYPDPESVVEDALTRLQHRDKAAEWNLDDLRAAAQIGLDQLERGEGIEVTGEAELEAFFDEVKSRGRNGLGSNRP